MNSTEWGNGPVLNCEYFKIIPIGENHLEMDVIFHNEILPAFRFVWRTYQDRWDIMERINEKTIPANKLFLGSSRWKYIGNILSEETEDPMIFVNVIKELF